MMYKAEMVLGYDATLCLHRGRLRLRRYERFSRGMLLLMTLSGAWYDEEEGGVVGR
jgi:hypothetical protein